MDARDDGRRRALLVSLFGLFIARHRALLLLTTRFLQGACLSFDDLENVRAAFTACRFVTIDAFLFILAKRKRFDALSLNLVTRRASCVEICASSSSRACSSSGLSSVRQRLACCRRCSVVFKPSAHRSLVAAYDDLLEAHSFDRTGDVLRLHHERLELSELFGNVYVNASLTDTLPMMCAFFSQRRTSRSSRRWRAKSLDSTLVARRRRSTEREAPLLFNSQRRRRRAARRFATRCCRRVASRCLRAPSPRRSCRPLSNRRRRASSAAETEKLNIDRRLSERRTSARLRSTAMIVVLKRAIIERRA